MRFSWMTILLLVPVAIGCGRTATGGNRDDGGSGGSVAPGGSGGDETGGSGGTGGEGGTGGVGGTGGEGGTGGVLCLQASALALAGESREPVIQYREGGELVRVHAAFLAPRDNPEAAARSVLSAFAADVGLAEDGGDLVLGAERFGLVGRYLRFGQTAGGLPVFDREVVVHVVVHEGRTEVRDLVFGHARLGDFVPPAPRLEAAKAIELAASALGLAISPDLAPEATLGVHAGDAGPAVAFRVDVATVDPVGSYRVFVDALDGRILEIRDRLQRADGTGLVYDPNPIATTGDGTLQDDDDATSPTLDAARYRAVLPRLDGTGILKGTWVDSNVASGIRVRSPELVFDYDRSQNGFEQTNVYFHLDRTQNRIQSLGFTDHNARVQKVYSNGTSEENSWYDPNTRIITTGTGGVDDGEDADVVVHEYGHAILDDLVRGFGSNDEAGAMGEGFGDYLAGSIAASLSQQIIDPACLAEWDGTAFMSGNPPCMRRLDGTKHYPERLEGEVHADGEIWSATLWNLRDAMGGDEADRLILESELSYTTGERFSAAAVALLDADRNLNGGRNLATIQRVLYRYGVLRTLVPPATFPDVLSTVPVTVENPRSYNKYEDLADDWKEIHQPGAAALRIHFQKIETELDNGCVGGACDNIYLYDGAGLLFQILNGTHSDLTSVTIPGDTVQIRLVTDPWVSYYGYKIDRIDVMGFATCGNGTIDPGETCDGAALGGATCEALGYGAGPLGCRPDCTLDVSDCPGAGGCGDGYAGPGEECDGADLQEATCATQGFTSGTLACTGACKLDRSGCYTCGDGVKNGPEACDGADLGGATCESGVGTPTCSAACTIDTSTCPPPC